LTWLALVIGVAVILRVGLAIFLGNEIEELRGGTYDQISYDTLALRVAEGHGFSFEDDWWPATRGGEPTAHWSYLYVIALAGIYRFLGPYPLIARLLQALLVGVLTPWLIYRIGRRVFSKEAGLVAAAISAIYAYFIMYGSSLMTESLYIVCILWSIDAAMRLAMTLSTTPPDPSSRLDRKHLLLGLELGLAIVFAILLRQVIVVFIGVLVLWLIWVSWRQFSVRALVIPLFVAFTVIALFVAPVIVRNYNAFGRLTSLNTNAGYAFFWSNHPIYGTRFESVLSPTHGITYQELIPEELLELDEASLDRALLQRGLEFIRDEPLRYLLLSASRIPVYFLFWPKSDSSLLSNAARLFSFALFLPAMIYGIILSVRRILVTHLLRSAQTTTSVENDQDGFQFEFLLLLCAFIVVYSLVHILSWANVRYRLPVDAILIIFAGYGLWDAFLRIRVRFAFSRSSTGNNTG
jgi:4-amino-4-deoxy-L-arabinose transferase-like glycosyltransferase